MSTQQTTQNQGARDLLVSINRRVFRVGMIVFFFSFLINILVLVSPIYMLQIYDRVLSSGSSATLLYLTIAAVCLLAALGALEHVRTQILTQLGGHVTSLVDRRLFSGVLSALNKKTQGSPTQPMRDLETIGGFFSGPGVTSLMDAPWVPFFLLIIYLMHPTLGLVALLGAVALGVLVFLTDALTRDPLKEAHMERAKSMRFLENITRNAQAIEAMGMVNNLLDRWITHHKRSAGSQTVASERSGMVRAMIKFLRPSLQAAMLGTGAYLALLEEITPGVIVAASIISGRALAPIEQAVGSWKQVVASREAYARLKNFFLNHCEKKTSQLELPKPKGNVSIEKLVGAPPDANAVVVKNVSFALKPGEFLGVVGPSGAGKSSLASLLVGVWAPLSGCVRIDGADITTWDKDLLGPSIGYLPQDAELFEGTVAENIARFGPIDSQAVLAASELAAVHEFILRLEDGYDTQVGPGGCRLSVGQRQRLALARAIYKQPAFIVLDEPNSHLDAVGEAALVRTLKEIHKQGSTIVLVCHRPPLLALADTILVLREGQAQSLGPADQVLKQLMGDGNVSRMPKGPAKQKQPEKKEGAVVKSG